MTEAERAALSARMLWENDRASRDLGMQIVSVEPGKAVVTMTVRETMTNGHGTAHGGFIFALADSAFAFACNSYGETTVAAHCSISYIRPDGWATGSPPKRARFPAPGVPAYTMSASAPMT
jgi:acyl-CoA thioesterase